VLLAGILSHKRERYTSKPSVSPDPDSWRADSRLGSFSAVFIAVFSLSPTLSSKIDFLIGRAAVFVATDFAGRFRRLPNDWLENAHPQAYRRCRWEISRKLQDEPRTDFFGCLETPDMCAAAQLLVVPCCGGPK
jgi:hypothetical protein